MRLIRIRLRYFRAHRDTYVEFPERGVLGLLGLNESGKSTVATEAVLFALYGAAAVRGVVSTLQWKGAHASQRPTVDLVFELDERYRVERTDRDCRVYVGNSDTPVAAGISASNAYLEKVLDLSYDQFVAVHVALQKDFARIAAMKPTERQTFIREVTGISRIDDALDACRKRANTLDSERQGIAAGMGDREPLERTLAEAVDAVSSAATAVSVAERAVSARTEDHQEVSQDLAASAARKEAHDAASRRTTGAEAEAKAARGEVERLAAELESAHGARAHLAEREAELAPLPALRQERDRLVAAQSTESERQTLTTQAAAAEHDIREYSGYIDECDAAIAAFDAEAFARMKDEYREVSARQAAITTERTRQLATAHAQADALLASWRDTEEQVATLRRLGEDSACPVCTKRLGADLQTVMDTLLQQQEQRMARRQELGQTVALLSEPSDDELALDAELDALKEQGENFRRLQQNAKEAVENRPKWAARVESCRERAEQARTRLATLPMATSDPVRLANVKSEIERLEKVDNGLAVLRAKAGRIELLHRQREDGEQRLADALARLERAREDLRSTGYDPEEHEVLVAAAATAQAALTSAKEELARAKEQRRAADDAHSKAEDALAAYDARAAQLQAKTVEVERHRRAAESLDRFRRSAAATLRPELEEYVSAFVAVLTDGRHESVTVTEDFTVICQEGGVDMEVVSGGAEDLVALAVRVALSRIVAERRGKGLSLLVLDEPFAYLDEVRRPAVLSFIRRLSEAFPQVVLISHVDETRFVADRIVRFEHDAVRGYSQIAAAGSSVDDEPEQSAPAPAEVAAA